MPIVYRIKDWDLHFENNKSRERDRLTWCAIPNKQDGLEYGRLMERPDGEELYGAFVAVVLVASKQKRPRDGHLTGTGRADGTPYTAADLAIKTKAKEAVISRMLAVCSSASIEWIEVYVDGARRAPAECPPSAQGRKGREGKGSKTNTGASAPVSAFSPPTLEQVQERIKEKSYHFTAEEFIGYYGSQGWKKANGRQVTDWQGCCVTFERTWKRDNPGTAAASIASCQFCHKPMTRKEALVSGACTACQEKRGLT